MVCFFVSEMKWTLRPVVDMLFFTKEIFFFFDKGRSLSLELNTSDAITQVKQLLWSLMSEPKARSAISQIKKVATFPPQKNRNM